MEHSILLMLLLQVVLIALNAIFACAEIAAISISDSRMALLIQQGNKKAKRLSRLTSQPARFLATIHVAITLSGFLASAFAAENFSDPLVAWLVSLGVPIPESTLSAASVIIITLILSYFTLIFGELVPKRVAMRKAEQVALGLSSLISAIATLFAPIVWLLTVSTNGVLRLLRIDPNADEELVGEEDIRMMVDTSSRQGAIDCQEQQFIQNVFAFDDRTAEELATHRTDLTILWKEEDMNTWDRIIRNTRHTRFPVCGDDTDDVIGILDINDYFRMEDKSREAVLKHAVRPAYFVPESVKADVLFQNMKSTGNTMAVVLDEYGGMTGIVTINDLVEQLVGELEDESRTPLIESIGNGMWSVSGDASLEDLSRTLGITIEQEDCDTFNGLIFSALGAIPNDGTAVEVQTAGLAIRITDIREHQVVRAEVQVLEQNHLKTDDNI